MAARNDAGNTEKAESSLRAAERLVKKLGVRIEQMDFYIVEPQEGMPDITELRFKIRYSTVGDVQVIIKGTFGNEKVIAFHSDDTFSEALVGVVNRLTNGSLKWREDTPYDQR